MRSTALTGMGLVLIAVGIAGSAPPAGDFAARLENTLQQVAAYEVVGDLATPVALAELVNATHGRPHERRELARRLAGMLTSSAPAGAKELACRQLSLIGTAEEVPAVAALLSDEKLSHLARFALERISDKAADRALRDALEKTSKTLRVGVINSIGARRDQEAVGVLAKLLREGEPEVSAAAARALGKIGGRAATETLTAALPAAGDPVRSAVADACLLAAEGFFSQGNRGQATDLYDRLRQAAVSKQVRRAATRGAILLRQSAGVPLLVDLLKGSDAEMFALGLRLVREMPQHEVPCAAAAALAGLSAVRQVRLIQVLAERGDRAAMPAVLTLADRGGPEVRAAAILGLARLGDASHVPMLVRAACDTAAEIAAPATAALTGMPDRQVDAALLTLASAPDAKTRCLVFSVLGGRRAASAVPALFQATADREPAVRLAAIKSLGATARLADLARLAGLLLTSPGPADRAAVEEAIASAAAAMSNKDACAEKLLALMGRADAEGKSALLRTLSQVGGPMALAAVSGAVSDASPEIQDVAVRALSNWTTSEAAGTLARIAQGSANRKHKILALRGYIRLIGSPEVTPEERLVRCARAMALAERDDERRLVLGALGNVGTRPALDRVLSCLDQPALQNEAAAAAIANGYRLLRTNPAVVAQAMNRVIATVDNKGLKRRAQDLLDRCK